MAENDQIVKQHNTLDMLLGRRGIIAILLLSLKLADFGQSIEFCKSLLQNKTMHFLDEVF